MDYCRQRPHPELGQRPSLAVAMTTLAPKMVSEVTRSDPLPGVHVQEPIEKLKDEGKKNKIPLVISNQVVL